MHVHVHIDIHNTTGVFDAITSTQTSYQDFAYIHIHMMHIHIHNTTDNRSIRPYIYIFI